MEVVQVPLSKLKLDPVNARRGDVGAIMESLKEFGQHRPLVCKRSDGTIIAGNHTYKAAQALGWSEISVYYVDDSDEKAIRRAIADNATGEQATWDLEQLASLVAQVGADIPGLDISILDSLNAKLDVDEEIKQQPTYPIVPKFSEKYDCVIIFATNEIDWQFLVTNLQLETNKSYKNKAIGQSHVVTAEVFAALWRQQGQQALPAKSVGESTLSDELRAKQGEAQQEDVA
jgi:hypothetical protein